MSPGWDGYGDHRHQRRFGLHKHADGHPNRPRRRPVGHRLLHCPAPPRSPSPAMPGPTGSPITGTIPHRPPKRFRGVRLRVVRPGKWLNSRLPRRHSPVTQRPFLGRYGGAMGRGGYQRDDGLDVLDQLGGGPESRFHPSHQARHAVSTRLAQPTGQFAQGRFVVTPAEPRRHRSARMCRSWRFRVERRRARGRSSRSPPPGRRLGPAYPREPWGNNPPRATRPNRAQIVKMLLSLVDAWLPAMMVTTSTVSPPGSRL